MDEGRLSSSREGVPSKRVGDSKRAIEHIFVGDGGGEYASPDEGIPRYASSFSEGIVSGETSRPAMGVELGTAW